MHRFFIPKDWIMQDSVIISGEPLHQIGYVLRLRPTNIITVLDNTGWEYEVEIEKISKEQVWGKVRSKKQGKGEPNVKITLYQALLKSPDKFELVLQKSVELGVTAFVPFVSERCVARKESPAKIERWEKIIREAAEQSERLILPVLNPIITFEEACKTVKKPALMLWEQEKSVSIKCTLQNAPFKEAAALNVIIGPEGGFPDSEKELAEKQGIAIASLGQRVLRAETASLAAISAVLYEKGEMGEA
jgi:16S rRNA (uracil1498-N3)-methyltransferase